MSKFVQGAYDLSDLTDFQLTREYHQIDSDTRCLIGSHQHFSLEPQV